MDVFFEKGAEWQDLQVFRVKRREPALQVALQVGARGGVELLMIEAQPETGLP